MRRWRRLVDIVTVRWGGVRGGNGVICDLEDCFYVKGRKSTVLKEMVHDFGVGVMIIAREFISQFINDLKSDIVIRR